MSAYGDPALHGGAADQLTGHIMLVLIRRLGIGEKKNGRLLHAVQLDGPLKAVDGIDTSGSLPENGGSLRQNR
jgi:hypothetical protein